jgi:hypothetical protein
MGRKVRTREGFIVDIDTGEVVDDEPLEFSDDIYWGLGSCPDERSVERFLNSVVPGLVAILKMYLRKELCRSSYNEVEKALERLWGADAVPILGSIFRRALREDIDVYEARAYDLAGLPGLTTYRCLRKAGYDSEDILKALDSYSYSEKPGSDLHRYVEDLLKEVRNCRKKALVRWISKPLRNSIDIEYASRVLKADIKSLGKLSYITTKISNLGIQITSSKVDISSRAYEYEKVLEVLAYLGRRLGVEFSKPIPIIATIVIRLPFRIDIDLLANHENGEIQGSRVKISRERYTILAYQTTVNIYAKLGGNIDKIDTVVAEALPTVCIYIARE